ncbi:trypsin-3-like [Anoplophora glabripennis]|uniref:trypsin-3-like n=1 Tax=Anoplophora glabripennis TaxID=217634 RepID=UPI000874C8F9|nr:trypsin-3-like [Anoplophora glabripennis]
MIKSSFTFLLLLKVVYVSHGNAIPGGRIVGGTPANISNYPYQVSILHNRSHSCGGSIISNTYILTAAHCTYKIPASQLSIRAGSSFHNSGGTVVAVSQIYQHTQFNPDTYDYDISVLKLKSRLTLGTNIALITMIAANTAIRNGDLAVATGWGQLTNDGAIPTQLHTVSLPTITTTTCAGYYGTGVGGITDRMFCAGYAEGGKDTCQGDSGGPLVLSGALIGITSWGDVCGGAKSPGVYTKLSLFRSYVDGIIK